MPSKSEKQRRFMGAELSRARAGKKTQTGMSEDKLSEFASKSMDAIDAYLHKVDIPDVKIKPGERIGGPGDRIQLVPKNPKKKGSEIKKSKRGRILPCGHHAEDGDAIDKACTMAGCSQGGSINPQQGKSGTVYTAAPMIASGIHQASGGSSSSGGATGSGTMTSSSPPVLSLNCL